MTMELKNSRFRFLDWIIDSSRMRMSSITTFFDSIFKLNILWKYWLELFLKGRHSQIFFHQTVCLINLLYVQWITSSPLWRYKSQCVCCFYFFWTWKIYPSPPFTNMLERTIFWKFRNARKCQQWKVPLRKWGSSVLLVTFPGTFFRKHNVHFRNIFLVLDFAHDV